MGVCIGCGSCLGPGIIPGVGFWSTIGYRTGLLCFGIYTGKQGIDLKSTIFVMEKNS